MSYLLGAPAHQCYVYPDFDKALARFTAAGLGPFFVLDGVDVLCDYRGERRPFISKVAFAYSGDSCIEVITPKTGDVSTFNDFLDRNPHGGLHHIAYYSDDFEATLARMEKAGKPLDLVVDVRDPASGFRVEIFCAPVGVEDPVLYQLMRPGLVESWFEVLRRAAAGWDGADPIRDAPPPTM
jgi:catechol 2,3-dioxygenase-like lactoylglutathione lyase family enzyme